MKHTEDARFTVSCSAITATSAIWVWHARHAHARRHSANLYRLDPSRVHFHPSIAVPAVQVGSQTGGSRKEVRDKRLDEENRRGNADWSREMQIFLLAFIVVEICEIFSVGGFPLDAAVRKVSRATPHTDCCF